LQNVSANVGGTINFLMIFIGFILSYYSEVPFLESIYEKIFNHNSLKVKNKQPTSLIIPNTEFSSILKLNVTNPTNHNLKLNKIEEKSTTTKNYYTITKPKKHNLCEIIFRKLIKKQKLPFYDKIKKHYESNLDVSKILKFSHQINFLNEHFFTEKERKLIWTYENWKFYADQESSTELKESIKSNTNSKESNEEIARKLNFNNEFLDCIIRRE